MKWPTIRSMALVAAFVGAYATASLQAGELRAWGLDRDGQVTGVPAGSNYTAVAVGDAHGLALRTDGAIAAWGQNDDGECDVPAGVYKAIGAGADFSLAIRADGSLVVWGQDGQGQVSQVPAGTDFVAVDGGEFFAVALKADGSLVAWGNDRWGQVSNVPAGRDFKAVVAGDDHAVALRYDGSLVSWGYWAAADPTPTSGIFTAIGAGGSFSVALKDDGSIVWWGNDPYDYGLDSVPAGKDFAGVAAGYLHGLALKQDGSLVGWGAGKGASVHPNWGQAAAPAGSDYTALACGLYFSVALAGKTEPADPTEPNDVPVVSDDFNDNSTGSLWRLQGEDLASCWLKEANQRLELMSTAKAQGIYAYYLSNDWRLYPTSGFSFRVDYHYSLVTDKAGWMFLGITPDVNELYTQYVKFGVGCDDQYSYLWYEAADGTQRLVDFDDRTENGTLYVSYDPALDELYVSGESYGSKTAWAVIPRVLGTAWRGEPVVVFLGGGTDGLEVQSGDVWLDNFIVDSGSLSMPEPEPEPDPEPSLIHEVYRFWSPTLDRHFYTISEAERDVLISEHSQTWTYEGPVYKAATTAFAAGLKPVYRFWSPTLLSHFYTVSEADKDLLINEYSQVWGFEGVAFYAYPEGAQPAECIPVYRFWKTRDGGHFYTVDADEKDRLLREYPDAFSYEGIAFYVYGL